MKTQDAGQAALFESPYLAEIPLVVLTTYSDRVALTVDEVRYLSTAVRLYDYGNTGNLREFQPWLVSIGEQRDTMNHVPSPDGSGLESTLRRVRKLRLRNRLPEDAAYLYPTLRAENLEFASVEIATLGVRVPVEGFRDLSALTGAEHTVVYRGRVSTVLSITDAEFELEVESELPQIPWLVADVSTADPKDRGARVPIIVGKAKRVPLVGWDVGAVSTLAEAVTKTSTTFKLTDATSFPTSGSAKIGTEEIAWTGKSGNDLTTVSRAQSSTRAAAHGAGEVLLELQTSATWLASSRAVNALGDLYCLSPYTDQLVRVTTAFTKTVADASTVGGQTVASISFSQAQLRDLINLLAQTPGVDEASNWSQEERVAIDASLGNFVSGVGASITEQFDFPEVVGRTLHQVVYRIYVRFEGTSATIRFRRTSGGSNIFNIVPNVAGVTEGWFEFPSSDAADMDDHIFIRAETNNAAHHVHLLRVHRVDYFTGTVRQKETRRPTTGPEEVLDGNDATAHVGNSVEQYTFPAVAGRVLVERVFRTRQHQVASVGSGDELRYRYPNSGSAVDYAFDLNGGIAADLELEWATNLSDGLQDYIWFNPTSTLWELHALECDEIWIGSSLEIVGAVVGYGLRFFIDADGPVASGGNYLAANGVVLEEMPDVLRWVLADLCGLGHGAIDSSFATVGGATYLDDNAHACDLRQLGEQTVDVLARLAFESRANLISDERSTGTVYRLLAALSTYAWPASVATLDRFEEISEEGRNGRTVSTRFRHLYQHDPSLGADADAFGAVRATTVSAAETKHGRHDAPAVGLATVRVQATADEIAGYFETELSRIASVFKLGGVPWSDAYLLERGDVVTLTVPWAGSVKARLIETSRREDGLIDVRAVAVP